jgi:hypothetical protein
VRKKHRESHIPHASRPAAAATASGVGGISLAMGALISGQIRERQLFLFLPLCLGFLDRGAPLQEDGHAFLDPLADLLVARTALDPEDGGCKERTRNHMQQHGGGRGGVFQV